MPAKVVLAITRLGEFGFRLLPQYSGCVMSIASNVFPSLLFCHWVSVGDGKDDTMDLIIVSEAKEPLEEIEIVITGTSEKKIYE